LTSAAGIDAWIENKLRMRAMRNLSWHILYGDGTAADQLAGWDNEADAGTYTWSSGEPDDTRFDAIIRAADLMPFTGQIVAVMNKVDKTKMQLSKGTDGHYIDSSIVGQMRIAPQGSTMFVGPYEIIEDDAVTPGDFFVVNLSEASELVDAQVNRLQWGFVNDQFARNEITARYDQRLLHSIMVPEAIVLGEFDSAP
jgi:HK97 family phage major capsid protein